MAPRVRTLSPLQLLVGQIVNLFPMCAGRTEGRMKVGHGILWGRLAACGGLAIRQPRAGTSGPTFESAADWQSACPVPPTSPRRARFGCCQADCQSAALSKVARKSL